MSESHVENAVAARIAAAKRRTEDMRRQRAELAAARRRGLAHRHAAKLRRLNSQESNADVAQTATTDPSRGDIPTVAEDSASTATSDASVSTTETTR